MGENARNAPAKWPDVANIAMSGHNEESAQRKWRYIEKSLINYNENSVPFLVNKYAETIIQGCEEIAGQYATRQL